MGRQRSPGVTGSRGRPEREAPTVSPPRICRVLQHRPSPHPSAGFADGPTDKETSRAGCPSHRIPPSRWPPPSIRVAGSGLIRPAHHPLDVRDAERKRQSGSEPLWTNKENRQVTRWARPSARSGTTPRVDLSALEDVVALGHAAKGGHDGKRIRQCGLKLPVPAPSAGNALGSREDIRADGPGRIGVADRTTRR